MNFTFFISIGFRLACDVQEGYNRAFSQRCRLWNFSDQNLHYSDPFKAYHKEDDHQASRTVWVIIHFHEKAFLSFDFKFEFASQGMVLTLVLESMIHYHWLVIKVRWWKTGVSNLRFAEDYPELTNGFLNDFSECFELETLSATQWIKFQNRFHKILKPFCL